jgi:hypothetical protein
MSKRKRSPDLIDQIVIYGSKARGEAGSIPTL